MGWIEDSAGSLVSGAVSGLFGHSSAQSQMRFQEKMANTQYQRAASDLEKAGLNRILALGSPAAAPSGALASINMPDLGSTSIGSRTSTAAKSQASTAEKAQATQRDLANSTIALQADQASAARELAGVHRSQVALQDAQKRLLQSQKIGQDITNKGTDPVATLVGGMQPSAEAAADGLIKAGLFAASARDWLVEQLLDVFMDDAGVTDRTPAPSKPVKPRESRSNARPAPPAPDRPYHKRERK